MDSSLLESATAIYSLKLINKYFFHPIITLRRSYDDKIINFKSDLYGNLNTFNNDDFDNLIPIHSIMAGSIPYVYILWDQSNNNNHLIQPNNDNQPYLDLTTKNIIFDGNQWLYKINGVLPNGINKYAYLINFTSFYNQNNYVLCEHNINTFILNQRSSLCVDNNNLYFKGNMNDASSDLSILPYNNYFITMNINNSSINECNVRFNINDNIIFKKSGVDNQFNNLYLNNYIFSIGAKLSDQYSEFFKGMLQFVVIFNNEISDSNAKLIINNLT